MKSTLPLAVLAAVLLAPSAPADTIRLENGRIMHGNVDRGYVDPEYLRIQMFNTGGVVKVRWEHIIVEDRDTWQVDLGLRESDEAVELKVDGHKILFVNNLVLIGMILNPDALSGGAAGEIIVQSKGKQDTYPRGSIAKAEPMRVDLALVYTPRQAYEIKRDEINPNNGPTHFDLAEYGKAVRAYEEAKEHLLKAKEDLDFLKTPQGKQIDSKLATLEILLRNKALQTDLDRVKVALIEAKSAGRDFGRTAQIYLEARDSMLRIMKQYEDKKIQAEFKIPDLAKRVETERRVFFQKRMPTEVYSWLRKAANEKSREQKVKDIPPGTDRQQVAILQMKGTFEGARQYFTRQATEDLWNHIIKIVGAGEAMAEIQKTMDKDPAKLTEQEKDRAKRLAELEKSLRDELQDYWTNRSKSGGYTTSYGTGSFIVVKSDLKLTRKAPPAGGGNRGRAGGAGQQQQAVDVIKTPDQWWEAASTSEKANWLLSWYAEKSGFLEVTRKGPENAVNCDNCGGLGYKKVNVASTGEEEAERCQSCNGCKVIQKIRWR